MAVFTVQEDTDIYTKGWYGNGRDLCSESGGRLWHGYRDKTRDVVGVAYSDDNGQNWTEDTTVDVNRPAFYSIDISIAIDSNDDLHCIYTRYTTGPTVTHLGYIKRTYATGDWTSEVVIATEPYAYDLGSICLFVDSNDYLHVLYVALNTTQYPAETEYALFYLINDGSWSSPDEIAYPSGGRYVWCCSGSVDSTDKVYAVFTADGYGTYPDEYNLIYMTKPSGGSWSSTSMVTDIEPAGGNGQWMSCMVVDSSDNIGIIWMGDGYGTNDTFYNIHFTRIVSDVVQAVENVTDVASNQGFARPYYRTIGLSIDQSDVYHAIWDDGSTSQHNSRTSGVWGSQSDLAVGPQWLPLWAIFPSHQILSSGYKFTIEQNKGGTDSDNKYFVADNAPTTPSNSSPVTESVGLSTMPTLESSAFSDPDEWSTHASSQWQVSETSGDYSSPVYDSGTDTSNLVSITVPAGNLSTDTWCYWHVRHRDDDDNWSSYSTETNFNTGTIGVGIDISRSEIG